MSSRILQEWAKHDSETPPPIRFIRKRRHKNKQRAATATTEVVDPAIVNQAVVDHIRAQSQLEKQKLVPEDSPRTIEGQEKIRSLRAQFNTQKKMLDKLEQKLESLQVQKEESVNDIREQLEKKQKEFVDSLKEQKKAELDEKISERKRSLDETLATECEKIEKRVKAELSENQQTEQLIEEEEKAADDTASTEQTPLESVAIQERLDDIGKSIETINENRSEMIWLLKRVIKAEEKRRAKSVGDKKSEAKIHASKQA